MMNAKFRYTALILAGLFLTGSAVFGAYQVGDHVEDFTLPDAFGESVSYFDYDGMVVMINFWTST